MYIFRDGVMFMLCISLSKYKSYYAYKDYIDMFASPR